MDEKKLAQLMENIEAFIEGSAKNNETILQELRSLKNDPKTAQILNEATKRHDLLLNEISGLISKEKALIEDFEPEVTVKNLNVNVNKPLAWILGAVFAIIISGLVSYFFIQQNNALEDKNKALSLVNMKYRYLRVAGLDIKLFNNVNSLITGLDGYYPKNMHYVDSIVFAKERLIREEQEAATLAKQRESEGKKALEQSKALKQKADSLKKAQ